MALKTKHLEGHLTACPLIKTVVPPVQACDLACRVPLPGLTGPGPIPPVKEVSHPTREWLVSPIALLVWQISTIPLGKIHASLPAACQAPSSYERCVAGRAFPSQPQLDLFMTLQHVVFSAVAESLSLGQMAQKITATTSACAISGASGAPLTITCWEASCAWN